MPLTRRFTGMSERVLVVDDSAFQRTVVRDALEGPFEVVGEAENGAEAVELFEAYEPDAVSMDVVMPEMTGIEATAAITDRWPDAVVVMCTSVDQQEKMMEAVKAGADGYVTKPVDADELVPEFRSHFG
ncbi:chemotaxis protein CheY [Halorubrum pallidum]